MGICWLSMAEVSFRLPWSPWLARSQALHYINKVHKLSDITHPLHSLQWGRGLSENGPSLQLVILPKCLLLWYQVTGIFSWKDQVSLGTRSAGFIPMCSATQALTGTFATRLPPFGPRRWLFFMLSWQKNHPLPFSEGKGAFGHGIETVLLLGGSGG